MTKETENQMDEELQLRINHYVDLIDNLYFFKDKLKELKKEYNFIKLEDCKTYNQERIYGIYKIIERTLQAYEDCVYEHVNDGNLDEDYQYLYYDYIMNNDEGYEPSYDE